MEVWSGFPHMNLAGTGREIIQLTSGEATCYPLYYFIPSFTRDGRCLVYHKADRRGVQLHALHLATGETKQITRANTPETRWIPWCIESGPGVLDHRSVLCVATEQVVYFDGNDACAVDLAGEEECRLFSLPPDRIAIGQNCMSPDGVWFVYIHHDRRSFAAVYPEGGSPDRCRSEGTVLAAYNMKTGEHRDLVVINSPIHHVVPYGEDKLVFCHPATENGMMLTSLDGGWYTHLRTQDRSAGCVCHYVTTRAGIAYEVLGRSDAVYSGLYDPLSHRRYEFALPSRFGYTHTGRDPEGLLWFYENSAVVHEILFLARHDPNGDDEWIELTGDWPTYGDGQKSHFHPQLTPDRGWVLVTAGDPQSRTNHIFLLNVSDLQPTAGIPAWRR